MMMETTTYLPSGFSPISDTTSTTSPSREMRGRGSSFGGESESTTMTADYAPRACEKCRSSKRKCDKTLPCCTRCNRLTAKCIYLADSVTSNPAATGGPMVIFQPQTMLNDVLLRGSSPLEEITATQIIRLISTDIQPGEKLDWVDATRSYFDCVHSWYAVVHRTLFEQQIASLRTVADSPVAQQPYSPPLTNTPSDKALSVHHASSTFSSAPDQMTRELALLIVSMYLSVRVRATDASERGMFDDIYKFVKRVLALTLLENPVPKMEVVQTGALLALYEYGHGDSFSAFRTLSETVAAARVLGVHPGRAFDDGTTTNVKAVASMEEEQKSGLWWALFILDQFIHRDEVSKHLPFILESPDENTLLPGSVTCSQISRHAGGYDVKYLCEPLTPPIRPLYINTQVRSKQMESFQLSAKVASLLHRALRHDYDLRTKAPGNLPAVNSFEDLDQEIRDTTLALLQDDINWQAALDCFAMCVSALFTLYLPFLPVLESKTPAEIRASTELTTALTAIRFAMQMSTDISCKLNRDIAAEVDSVKYLAAPAAPTCYLVVVAYAGLRKVFPEEWDHCQTAMIEKYESLKIFSHRWGIAEKIMCQLEEVAGLDRNEFLKSTSISAPLADGCDRMDLSR